MRSSSTHPYIAFRTDNSVCPGCRLYNIVLTPNLVVFSGVELRLSPLFRAGLQIGPQFADGTMIVGSDSLPYLDAQGATQFTHVETMFDMSTVDLNSRVYGALVLPFGLSAELGLNIGVNLSNSFSTVLRLVGNDTVTFHGYQSHELSEDRRMVTLGTSPSSGYRTLRLDADITAAKSIVLGRFTIQLRIQYRQALTNIHVPRHMFARSVTGGILFAFDW